MNITVGLPPDGALSSYSGQPLSGIVLTLHIGNTTTLYFTLTEAAHLATSIVSTVESVLKAGAS